MTVEATMYNIGYEQALVQGLGTMGIMLVRDTYTFDPTHETLSEVTPYEVVQVDSPDNGYTTGGQALTGISIAKSDSPPGCNFDADNSVMPALTADFKYIVIYFGNDGTAGGQYLYACIDVNSGGGEITISGTDLTVNWAAVGITVYQEA